MSQKKNAVTTKYSKKLTQLTVEVLGSTKTTRMIYFNNQEQRIKIKGNLGCPVSNIYT